MYQYSDDNCNSLTITSSWKNSKKTKDNSCQTSIENDFVTRDTPIQTGTCTIAITKNVKTKDDGASLLAYCKGRIKKYDDNTWLGLLDQGTVTVGKYEYMCINVEIYECILINLNILPTYAYVMLQISL